MDKLVKVLKSLKKDKSRDPQGLINELFRPEVAGSDLQNSILLLLNLIKKEQKVPIFLRSANITTFLPLRFLLLCIFRSTSEILY